MNTSSSALHPPPSTTHNTHIDVLRHRYSQRVFACSRRTDWTMQCRVRVCLPHCRAALTSACWSQTFSRQRDAWQASSALCAPRRLCSNTAKPTAPTPAAEPKIRVDPSRLPRTIPGMSPEELASRIETYQSELMAQEAKMSVAQMEAETETMRRSLSPEGFQAYLERTAQMHAKVAKETAKMAAMSPEELYRYQQKQRRKAVRYEWYKTLMLIFVFLATLFFLFFFFVFFT